MPIKKVIMPETRDPISATLNRNEHRQKLATIVAFACPLSTQFLFTSIATFGHIAKYSTIVTWWIDKKWANKMVQL
jgi:hypothetical protein